MGVSIFNDGVSLMSAYGATFWRSVDGLSFHQVRGVVDLTPPDISRTTVDNSEPETDYEEKKAGVRKIGDISGRFSVEGNPDVAVFMDDFESDTARWYRIDYGDQLSVTVQGFVTKCTDDAPISSRITRQITISITGTPVLNNRGA